MNFKGSPEGAALTSYRPKRTFRAGQAPPAQARDVPLSA